MSTLPPRTDLDHLIFDHIPSLRELLPRTGGTPGVHYAQVCTHNAMDAQREGWVNLANAAFYRIQGPKGFADMVLMKRGKPIAGASLDEGARRCFVDQDIDKLTGHNPNPPKDKEPTNAGSGQVSQPQAG